jgi:hypothetical protein
MILKAANDKKQTGDSHSGHPPIHLRRCQDDADHQPKEGYTLNERSGDDHRGTKFTVCFWLAGSPFQGRCRKKANADACSESNEACTDSGAEISE